MLPLMKQERWYQTQLESGHNGMITWVDRKLKPGQVVTLMGDKRKWKVIEQYATPGKPSFRRWNVGGIESEAVGGSLQASASGDAI